MNEMLTATLTYIKECIHDNQYPPSLQDVADHFHISRSTALYRMRKLVEKGAITVDGQSWRTTRILS